MKEKWQSMISMTSNADDYEYNNSIWSEDDERVAKLKYIISKYLTDTEKIIFLNYAECNSNNNELARKMGVNAPTLRYYIKKIIQKIKYYYDN